MSAVLILLVVAIICWFLAAIPLPWGKPGTTRLARDVFLRSLFDYSLRAR
jgi:hypothetical protein